MPVKFQPLAGSGQPFDIEGGQASGVGDMLYKMAQAKFARGQQDQQFGLQQQAQDRLAQKEFSDEDAKGLMHNAQVGVEILGHVTGNRHEQAQHLMANAPRWDSAQHKWVVGGHAALDQAKPQADQTQLPTPPAEQAQASMAPAVEESQQMQALRPPKAAPAQYGGGFQPPVGGETPQGAGGYAPNVERAHGQPHAYMPAGQEMANLEAETQLREAEAARRAQAAQFQGPEGPLLHEAAVPDLAAASVTPEAQAGYQSELEHAQKLRAMEAKTAAEPHYTMLPGFPGRPGLSFSRPQLRKPMEDAADTYTAQMTAMSKHYPEWVGDQLKDAYDKRYADITSRTADLIRMADTPAEMVDAKKNGEALLKALIAGDKAPGNQPLSYPQQLNKATAGARVAAAGKEKAAAGPGSLKPTDVIKELTEVRKSQIDKFVNLNQSLGHGVDSLSGNNPVAQKMAVLHMLRDAMGRINQQEIAEMGGMVSGLIPRIESAFNVAAGEGYGSVHLKQLLDEIAGQVQGAKDEVIQRGTAAAQHTFSDHIYDPHRSLIDSHIRGWFAGAGMEPPATVAKPAEKPTTIQDQHRAMGQSKTNTDLAGQFGLK